VGVRAEQSRSQRGADDARIERNDGGKWQGRAWEREILENTTVRKISSTWVNVLAAREGMGFGTPWKGPALVVFPSDGPLLCCSKGEALLCKSASYNGMGRLCTPKEANAIFTHRSECLATCWGFCSPGMLHLRYF
jgi:hypothetical protein